MRYIVLGMGVSGQAAVDYLRAHGHHAEGFDDQQGLSPPNLEKGMTLIVSPGVPPTHPLYQQARIKGIPVVGETELGLRHVRDRCVGITGSNGKTTVTLLTTHILNSCGCPARAVGNVGVPVCRALLEHTGELLVVELSSFQLETLQAQVFDVVALLNLTPNHLDRHADMEEYRAAKMRIFDCLKPGGVAIRPADLPTDQGHDTANLEAAVRICEALGIPRNQALDSAKSFKKPEHRLEWVAKIKGVSYYNDSKATNIAAVESALRSLPGPCVLIAGGVHKGASYRPWIPLLRQKARAVCAFGQAAPLIASELGGELPVILCTSLEAALEEARQRAQGGDQVLLSPGCSSYDMFTNYVQRGSKFKELVHNIEK